MGNSTYDSTGISLIRYAEILQNQIDAAKASWDESIDTSVNTAEDAFLGHWLRDFSLVVDDINGRLQEIYDTMSVANSTGARLDHQLSLIGLSRPQAAKSTVELTLTASKATPVAAGKQYGTSAGLIFETDTAITFSSGSYPEDKTVSATCTIYGPHDAAIGEVNQIITSVDGITAVTNAAAAVPGRYRATSAEQKASHTIAVSTSGDGDEASIYEALIAVTGVSAASVFGNDTDLAVDGVPARNLNCVVIGGTGADIAEAIHVQKTSSVPTFGATSVEHYDTTTRQTKTINYDIGTEVPIFVDITITLIEGLYDDDYQTQIRDQLITHFADFRIGDDVIYNALYKPIYTVDGFTVTSLKIDTTATPTGTTDEAMTRTQLATFTLDDAATNLTFTVL